MFDYEALQTEIFTRFWRCNDMSKKQAEDYAAIAIDVIKKANQNGG